MITSKTVRNITLILSLIIIAVAYNWFVLLAAFFAWRLKDLGRFTVNTVAITAFIFHIELHPLLVIIFIILVLYDLFEWLKI